MRLGPVLPALATYLGMLVAVCPCVEAAEGPDTEALFESLYGGDVAKATRTRDKADDVALAAHLLETARGQDIRPALAAVLAEKAIALGARHPDGYDTAVDAADLMIEVAPEKAAEAYERLIDVREQQHRAAKGIDKIGAAETLIETLLMAADAHLDGGDVAFARDGPLRVGDERDLLAGCMRFDQPGAAAGCQTGVAPFRAFGGEGFGGHRSHDGRGGEGQEAGRSLLQLEADGR